MKNQPRREVPHGPIIPQGSLAQALQQIPDPRRPFGWHPAHPPLPLVSLLLLTVVALLSGANSYAAIAQWGQERLSDQPELLLALGFPPHQSPSVTTLHRLFCRLDRTVFETVVAAWLAQSEPEQRATGRVLAVDGQTLRAVAASEVPASHVVSAYAVHAATVLARVVVATKSYEQSACDTLLAYLPVQGQVVTFDALHTHRDVCQSLDDAHATFLAPVKGNQPTLLTELETAFTSWPQQTGVPPLDWQDDVRRAGGQWEEYVEAAARPTHGRREWRRVCVWRDPRWAQILGESSEQALPWPMIQQVIRVERCRQQVRRHQIVKTEREVVYFVRNHPASARQIAQQVRAHWGIENRLHRQRDVLFDQDRCTIRLGSAPHLFIALRDLVLTLLHRAHVPNCAAARRSWAARPHHAASFVLAL